MPYKNREDQLAAQRRHYQNNREFYLQRNKIRKRDNRQKVRDYKTSRGCSICGESHFACLSFHHIDPNDKKLEVNGLISRGYSWKVILREIEKCIILCENCHRKEHYNGS